MQQEPPARREGEDLGHGMEPNDGGAALADGKVAACPSLVATGLDGARRLTRTVFRTVICGSPLTAEARVAVGKTQELGGSVPRDAVLDEKQNLHAILDPPRCGGVVGVPCSTRPCVLGFELCCEYTGEWENMVQQRNRAFAKFHGEGKGVLADVFCLDAGSLCPPELDILLDNPSTGHVTIVLVRPTPVRVLTGVADDPQATVYIPVICGPGPDALPWKPYGIGCKPLNCEPSKWLRRLGTVYIAALKIVIAQKYTVETTASAVDLWNDDGDSETGNGRQSRLHRVLNAVVDLGEAGIEDVVAMLDALGDSDR